MRLRQRAQTRHTLGRRSAACALGFLEADSQTEDNCPRLKWHSRGGELFDGHLVVMLLFGLESGLLVLFSEARCSGRRFLTEGSSKPFKKQTRRALAATPEPHAEDKP